MKKNNLEKHQTTTVPLSNDAVEMFILKIERISNEMKNGNYNSHSDEDIIQLQTVVADEDIFSIFIADHKENKDYLTVLQKVRMLDLINSTNIRMNGNEAFSRITNVILSIKDFDDRVMAGDWKLVTDLSKDIKNVLNVNLFSFATKYCCYHNFTGYGKDDYCIYDIAMKKALSKYINVTQTYIENLRVEMQYKEYRDIVDKLIKEYEIHTKKPRRDTDLYLWYSFREVKIEKSA